MTSKQRFECVREMGTYTDRDAFVSDLALSSLWGDAEDAEIPPERIAELGELWDAAHRSIKEIAASAGMSNRQLSERFCISYRTVENWSAGDREPPVWVLLMMQECLGKNGN